jgi:hypothetical protein
MYIASAWVGILSGVLLWFWDRQLGDWLAGWLDEKIESMMREMEEQDTFL